MKLQSHNELLFDVAVEHKGEFECKFYILGVDGLIHVSKERYNSLRQNVKIFFQS